MLNKVEAYLTTNNDKKIIIDTDSGKEVSASDIFKICNALLAISLIDSPIIVYGEKNQQFVSTCIAIYLLGGTFIPVNKHNTPKNSLESIVRESDAKLIISQGEMKSEGSVLICPYSELSNWCTENSTTYSSLRQRNQVSYIIFTSGTTGQPKGVKVTYEGFENTILQVIKTLKLNSSDATLCLSDIAFDLSIFDIFAPLAFGGKIFITANNKPSNITKLLSQCPITIWNSVPSIIDDLLCFTNGKAIDNALKHILLSGDFVTSTLMKSISEMFKNASSYVLGGATECSIWSCIYRPDKNTPYKLMPYGQPIKGQYLKIQKNVEQQGELLIGGVGVCLGYTSNATSKFIQIDGIRYFKTGDLVKENKDKTISLLGRSDFQVKVNGYRCNLTEIKSEILRILNQEVRQCLVKKHPTLEAIVLYIVPHEACKVTDLREDSLIDTLKYEWRMRDFEVPRRISLLKKIPTTRQGKLDQSFMHVDDLKDKILNIIAMCCKGEIPSSPKDLSSLERTSILIMIEDKLSVGLSINDFFKCQSLNNIVELVHQERLKHK